MLRLSCWRASAFCWQSAAVHAARPPTPAFQTNVTPVERVCAAPSPQSISIQLAPDSAWAEIRPRCSCKMDYAMAAIIQVENVSKTYRVGKVDVPAVRGVSLEVERGDFISLVGPSGSGKSTLFYILCGLAKADSGRLLLDGSDFAH